MRRGHLPAHGPVILLSLSLSFSLSVSPLHRSRSDGGGGTVHGAPTPFQPSAPLYNILALCFSSLVILANDYEVRISVGPPGISRNVPEIGTHDSRKSIRMDKGGRVRLGDPIGRVEERRGKWIGWSREDLFRLFNDTDRNG